MKSIKIKAFVLVLSLILCLNLMTGCKGKDQAGSGTDEKKASQDTSDSSDSNSEDKDTASKDGPKEDAEENAIHPVEGNPELTYWVGLASNVTAFATNYSELPFRKNLEKATGIKVKYEHPPSGQELETLNVLLASGEYPDIIEYAWPGYSGGVTKLFSDGVILELTDLMKQYAPNLTAYYKDNPEIAKQVKSDDGKYYLVPFIRGSKELRHTSGPVLRMDWLKEAKLDPPGIISEWETALTAFRKQQDCPAPFSGSLDHLKRVFIPAFEIGQDFYPVDKTVKYGPAEDGYKEFLATMADWYEKGLIDPNFSTMDRTIQDSNMTTGKGGSTYAAGGGQMGPYIQTAQGENPEYDLVPATFPTKSPGEKPKYISSYEFTSNGHAVITTSCRNPEAAMRFLDYPRSEEGHILYNFGMEGESFDYVNGVPTYSDLVMNNPDGLTTAQAMSKYCLANVSGPFTQDLEYIQQYYQMPQQKQALINWSDSDEQTSVLPPITFTPEESSKVSRIMTEVETYRDEMTMKIIMGSEPVSKVDEFQSTLKDMSLDNAIGIYQTALDRYYAR